MEGSRSNNRHFIKATLLFFRIAGLSLLVFYGSGCATLSKSDSRGKSGAVGEVIRTANLKEGAKELPQSRGNGDSDAQLQDVGELWVLGQKLRHTRFDYPVTVNSAVEHWVRYFTGKGRPFFEKYLQRGRYFIPEIARVLRSHNMPHDLVYLAMIESGFNNSARSHARAVGPWQFIKGTGMRYGLAIDYWLDERRDTQKSTLAAIAYLKELHEEFGSWELAAAGYNAGENKVRRAIHKYRTNDFWEIARGRFFRRETRDYVPKIIAAAILTKNAAQFGFSDPFEEGDVKNPTLMAGVDSKVLEEPTPKELGEPAAKADEATEDPADLKDEKDRDVAVNGDDDEAESAATLSDTPNAGMTPSVYMVANPHEQIVEFEVKGPADLFAVSRAAGVPFSTVKMLNPELRRWCTPPYLKTYKVRLPASSKERFLATYNDESFDRRVVFSRYTVRRGDTVQRVATRFGLEAGAIREVNAIRGGETNLRVGSQINLPLPTGHKRVIASMYDDKPERASRRRRARRFRRSRRSAAYSESVGRPPVHYRLRPNVALGS